MEDFVQVSVQRIFDNRDCFGKLRAVVSLAVSTSLGRIAIHNIKVIQGPGRLFVAMPNQIDKRGTFHDIVHPIGEETRDRIEIQILNEYQNVLEKRRKKLLSESEEL